MIETAYVKGGRLYAIVSGREKKIDSLSFDIPEGFTIKGDRLYAIVNRREKTIESLTFDRLERVTIADVTYVKDGRRYLWSENGSTKNLGSV